MGKPLTLWAGNALWLGLVLGWSALSCSRPMGEGSLERQPERSSEAPGSGGENPVQREERDGKVETIELDAQTQALATAGREVALLAGGCFWGMEDILRAVPGVLETEVGYTGGSSERPTYEQVRRGTTGHAESVRVVFDPARLSYAELLERWFFRMHDPTTQNRQGNDVGTQYRSVIFYTTPEQREQAAEVIRRLDAGGQWGRPIVTELVPARAFTPAEEYHQDYLVRNPGGYTCHYLREF